MTVTAMSRVRRHLTSALLAASMLACGGTSDVSSGDASDNACACSKTVHRPLSCTCSNSGTCQLKLAEYSARQRCEVEAGSGCFLSIKSTGCGKVSFSYSNSVGGTGYTFDVASGELLGEIVATDVAGESCGGSGTLLFGPGQNGGIDECASVESCILCGGEGGTYCPTGAGLSHCM